MKTSFSTKKESSNAPVKLTNEELDDIIYSLSQNHLFDIDRLLTWLASIATDIFWTADSDDAIAYPAPAQKYLTDVFYARTERHYADAMRKTARTFWEVRNKQTQDDPMRFGVVLRPVMIAALMALAGQLNDLKALQYFCSDACKTDDVDAMTPFLLKEDSTPELQDFCYDWLSFHFRFYANEYWEELEGQRLQKSQDDDQGSTGSVGLTDPFHPKHGSGAGAVSIDLPDPMGI